MSLDNYQYEPLHEDQIRLLELELASPEKELAGKIHVMKLPPPYKVDDAETDVYTVTGKSREDTEVKDYLALSHHWGPRDDERYIRIIKDNDSYQLKIRKSLEPALKALRQRIMDMDKDKDKDMCKLVWIDAICINQGDTNDKSMQIPRMAHIYNGAKRVFVWLGEAFTDSDSGMRFVRELQNLEGLGGFLTSQDSVTQQKWKAFLELTRQAWFHRRWIVQEIAVAKDAVLVCGPDAVSWDEFAGAVSLFASKNDEIRTLLKRSAQLDHHPDYIGEVTESAANKLVEMTDAIIRKRDDGTIAEHLLSLEALISTLAVFQVSEPRDIIYAILHLSNDARPVKGPDQLSALNYPEANRSRDQTPSAASPSSDSGVVIDRGEELFYHMGADMQGPSHPTTEAPDKTDIDLETRQELDRSVGPYLSIPEMPSRVQRGQYEDASGQVPIKVDYKMPVFNVCRTSLNFIIKKSQSLDIICFPWAPKPEKDEPKHPTWLSLNDDAPFDFDSGGRERIYRRVRADPLVGKPGTGSTTYLACGKRKAKGARIEDRCLVSRGRILDRVEEVGFPALEGVIPEGWLRMAGWTDLTAAPPEKFWRTLVADRGHDGAKSPPRRWHMACKWVFQRKPARGQLNPSQSISWGECPETAKEFLRRVLAVVWRRCLFTVPSSKGSEGLLGLGPETTKPGDLICILYGCSVPVLLREIPKDRKRTAAQAGLDDNTGTTLEVMVDGAEEPTYEFVGECYVHGMMSGECFKYTKQRRHKEQDFHIF